MSHRRQKSDGAISSGANLCLSQYLYFSTDSNASVAAFCAAYMKNKARMWHAFNNAKEIL